ncbi:MAG TPA: 2-deoxyribose-5-phosphate aldolase, partial [Sedimentibacter sp.]|nr:2-deoxyribose-5-phosphate aldolase [Sedimentibacter sp.]
LLFKKHIGQNVKIKASGGIKTIKDMEDFIDAGCSRLGTSSAVKLINNA